MPKFAVLFLALSPYFSPTPTVGNHGPQVGAQAPEPGFHHWIQRGTRKGSTLQALRGDVVIIHTFAWNCSSCLRVGIPLAVALEGANLDRGLRVLSVTTPAETEETKRVLKQAELSHAVAMEAPLGSNNPYVDVEHNSITHMFVIGRNGNLVWHGDPSTKQDEFIEAVEQALNEAPGLHLDRTLHPELGRACADFYKGKWSNSRRTAALLAKKQKTGKGDTTLLADAEYLVDRIDVLTKFLVEDLSHALSERDGIRALQVNQLLEERLEKSSVAKQVKAIWAAAEKDADQGLFLERAELWLELMRKRPALFPVSAEKREKDYSKGLRKFLKKNADSPYNHLAKQWLSTFEQLH
ncbi:MAG: hypothetical protein ACI9F9_001455 [Candidatus Paceibacteria bacterium]|jgi:hypothetical protein